MKGVVASGHPAVSDGALEVLRAGGNAFDAAVAAGFASSVIEPALTSLGGGGFLLARTLDGTEVVFDFFVDTPGRGRPAAGLEPHFVPVTVRFPASEQVFNVGLGSAAVPGTLAGLLRVHERLGQLPLGEVLQPAIRYARDGVSMNAEQAYFLRLLHPIMTLTDGVTRLYAPGGRTLGEGERLANPDLAAFLESLPADRGRSFYEGELAARVAADMQHGDGLLTQEDLRAYRVVEREPLRWRYRGRRLLTNPPPSFGGGLIALSLRLLESLDLGALPRGSGEHLAALVTVMEEVDRLRATGCLSPAALEASQASAAEERLRISTGGTTHVSVIDAAGNAASMTTSNGEGSGYVVPGTGVMLNNMMGEDDLHPEGFHSVPPGERVSSMMSPSMLVSENPSLVSLVLGSGGSKRIRTVLMQVISSIVDHGRGVEEAVHAPRVHWDGECVHVEPGFPEDSVEVLRRRWPVNPWPGADVYFGGVNAVAPDGQAGADPRRGGGVASEL